MNQEEPGSMSKTHSLPGSIRSVKHSLPVFGPFHDPRCPISFEFPGPIGGHDTGMLQNNHQEQVAESWIGISSTLYFLPNSWQAARRLP